MKHLQTKNSQRKTCTTRLLALLVFACFAVGFTHAQVVVSGVVVDENAEPLIGVNVIVKNTTTGTTTDFDGNYSLTVPDSKSVLVFSLVGLTRQEIVVGGKTIINVQMKEDSQLLDDVVVIGFQSQKKVNLTASVANIGAEALENRPVANIGQALQGMVPNLNIAIKGGSPNEVPSFNVRGGTTIRQRGTSTDDKDKFDIQNGQPLIMIDGIEVTQDDLNQMNPNDIANISILKDASAAAIYGTRATFGVILVQTKGGSFNQKTRVNYSYDVSWDRPAALPDILDSYHIYKSGVDRKVWTYDGEPTEENKQIMEKMLEYMKNPTPENAYFMKGDPKEGVIVWVANTNPYKEALKDWAPTQKHNLSVSGGTDKVSYYISLGMQNQEGMYDLGAGDLLRRYNIMTNINSKINRWFNLGAKATYNINNFHEPTAKPGEGNLWYVVKSQYPSKHIYMPPVTGPDDPVPNSPTDNILGYYQEGGRDKQSRQTGLFTITPEFIIIPGELVVKGDFSYTVINFNREKEQPASAPINESWVSPNTYSTLYSNGEVYRATTNKYTVNIYADYNKTFFDHHNFSVLAGFNQERKTYARSILYLKRLLDPKILNPEMVEDQTLNTSKNEHHEVTARAFFGRLMYNYKGKYLAEFDMRYDGSSRFPTEDRFQTFPTFSLGWRISEEKFMDVTKAWLDNLKVRASWGKLGSQPSDEYPYQKVYDAGSAQFLFDGTSYPTAVKVPNLVNPYLTWEKSVTKNLGIDIMTLQNRLDVVFDIYERKTVDILVEGGKEYPTVLGATPPYANEGSIKAYGWELSAKWTDRLSNGLQYSVGVTLSDSQTKVLSYPSNDDVKRIGDGKPYAGQMVGDIWGYETGGILQESDFDGIDPDTGRPIYNGVIFANEKVFPGYIWYNDLNGDGIISEGDNTVDSPGDRKIIGNNTPRYRYGITANFQYKGFDLDLFFQGVLKRDIFIGTNSSYWGVGAGSWETYKNSWTPENTGAKFPMYGYSFSKKEQTGYLLNGAYLMLRQAVLGYSLPKSVLQKFGVEKLRFHVSGYNLFSITQIPKSFDPEQVSDLYPHKQSFAIGVQVGF